MGTKIDLEQLTREIRILNSRNKLYHLLKLELGKRGWWKNKKRGNPSKGFKISRGIHVK
jgi:hypothetical protein